MPAGLTFEQVGRLFEDAFGEPLRKASYAKLSSWKRTGAYRLWLSNGARVSRTLIFKDARFNLDDIPALDGLPVAPGPPEYSICRSLPGPLARYLPAAYLCQEVIPGRHYRYVLEDVAEGRRFSESGDATLAQVRLLPGLHRAMADWSEMTPGAEWLEYGLEFSLALQQYVTANLTRYAEETNDASVRAFCEQMPRVADLHASPEFHEICPRRPIHGDYNPWNLLVSDDRQEPPKILDWEWAGLGVPHMDLASLLKVSPDGLVEEALALYASQEPGVALQQHRRLYYWCKLERGMLDAAFLAVQEMDGRWQVKLNLRRRVVASLKRALSAFDFLA
ncbi:MAG: phosphotransferase [Planctomycetota bacterium]